MTYDTKGIHWYDKYLDKVQSLDLIETIEEAAINKAFSRKDVIKVLAKFFGSKESIYDGEVPTFADYSSLTDEEKAEVDLVAKFGIVNGDDESKLNMNQTLTRAELVTMK